MVDKETPLPKKWFNILQKDGFEDIEKYKGGYYQLRTYSTRFSKKLNGRFVITRDEYFFKKDYYYYALHFVTSEIIKSKLERDIWFMHAQGMSYREIGETVRKRRKIHKNKIFLTIKKLKPAFLKYWQYEVQERINDINNNKGK